MASKTVSSLYVEFRASTKQFADDVGKMKKEVKEFQKFLTPFKEFSVIGKNVGLGLIAAGTAVGGALAAAVKIGSDYGDMIRDVSIQTGIATDQIAGLKLAADQSGTSIQAVQGALKKFAVNVYDAANGSKQSAKMFTDFGISIKDGNGKLKPITTLLGEFSERFRKAPPGIQQTAIATKFMGKSAGELTEFLSLGVEGFIAFQKQAVKTGLAISPEAAKRADDFKDAVGLLKSSVIGLSSAVADPLLPTLQRLAERSVEGTAALRKFANEHKQFGTVVGGAALVITGAGGLLVGAHQFLVMLPDFTRGVRLAGIAFKGLGQAMSALTLISAVKNFGDLSAVISLMGNASIIAKGGMVGLAAAVGTGAGMLVNWAIAGTRAEKVLDSITQMIALQIPLLGRWILGWTGVVAAQEGLEAGTKRMAAALATQGIVVERGKDSLDSYYERLRKAHVESALFANTAARHAAEEKKKKTAIDGVTNALEQQQRFTKNIQELPHALPWFMRSGAAGGFAPNMQGGIGRGSGNLNFPQPEMPQVASVSPRSSGGGQGVSVAVTYAPNMKFDGVPADQERYFRNVLAPLFKDGVRYNVEGVRDAVEAAMRKQGAAFSHG